MIIDLTDETKAVIQEVVLPDASSDIKVYVKRLDLIHPHITGNKWYKLKYNLAKALADGYDKLLTFGGAFSNHIYSTAAAGKEAGLKTIGIIRGEEHLPLNPTLSFTDSMGMELHYKSRSIFRKIHTGEYFDEIKNEFGHVYILPEGGSNELAVKGCAQIPGTIDREFDYLCTPCGTGGTISGLIAGSRKGIATIGFPVLKGGEFLEEDIKKLLSLAGSDNSAYWKLFTDYHFGGYAKLKFQLVEFKGWFEERNNIPLDYIYTCKMFYGINDLLKKGYFNKGTIVMALHTGGLQGNAGMQYNVDKIMK